MTHAKFPHYFPPAESADEDGIVCFGGRLSPDWLLDAYRHGIFPWPIFDDASLLAWWSPDPRAIIPLEDFHVSKRLERTLRSERFRVTCNQDFAGVVHGCATGPAREDGTWLNDDMIAGYTALHHLGYAHSVEAWDEDRLVGGVYGVAIGGLFAAESMFRYERDASKVALVSLLRHLVAGGFTLFDIQQLTPHTERFGAREIPRREYLERMQASLSLPVEFGDALRG